MEASRTIWKFSVPALSEKGEGEISVPRGSRVISLGPDPTGSLSIWAVVDPTAPKTERVVRFIPTGELFPAVTELGDYLATLNGGGLVCHVFVGPESPAS